EPLVTSDDQRADPQAFAAECRAAHCAEQDDLQLRLAAVGGHGLGAWRGECEDGREGNQRRGSHAAAKRSGCATPYVCDGRVTLPRTGDGRIGDGSSVRSLGKVESVVITVVTFNSRMTAKLAQSANDKTRALAHTFDDLGKRRPQTFRIDLNIHARTVMV